MLFNSISFSVNSPPPFACTNKPAFFVNHTLKVFLYQLSFPFISTFAKVRFLSFDAECAIVNTHFSGVGSQQPDQFKVYDDAPQPYSRFSFLLSFTSPSGFRDLHNPAFIDSFDATSCNSSRSQSNGFS